MCDHKEMESNIKKTWNRRWERQSFESLSFILCHSDTYTAACSLRGYRLWNYVDRENSYIIVFNITGKLVTVFWTVTPFGIVNNSCTTNRCILL
jgi:hypothetical protein